MRKLGQSHYEVALNEANDMYASHVAAGTLVSGYRELYVREYMAGHGYVEEPVEGFDDAMRGLEEQISKVDRSFADEVIKS